ncbi:MAG: tRNA (N6-isopentenyl adenosine(37)-C2)-methylthiotransferase MiaB [Clostridia bacterium]|nr:tRNA (N6-isopentenyl adenosine(37)-C2)-methylthiotransferase MiaB [Clostridia bacterium]
MSQIRAANDAHFAATGKRRLAFVLTLGCQQNEADSEKLMGMAIEMGYEKTESPESASLIMVNTCAIREHAEKRALSLVGQYKHIKAKNPDLIIVVCGCMVVQEHRVEDIKMRYPYVDILFGPSLIHRMPEHIWNRSGGGKRIFDPDNKDYRVAEGLPIRRESNYRAWVSVMYGCNNFCSYCIVPYVRGRERSRRKEDVIAEFRALVEAGYKDITLLGQNVNSYGKDSGFDYDFADLLCELDKIEGDYLIHFMTSHPKDATRKLIDVMADSRHVAKHFHLPMQSGSDRVLKVMNRKYDFEKYISTLDYIRERIEGVTVTSDIIVGFPGETEEDFEDTMRALRRARFDMIYSFQYSPRKGTPAAAMDCQIPKEIKGARFDRMLALQDEISYESNKKLEGRILRVLCDGPSKNNRDIFSGRTEGGKIVFFEGTDADIGNFVDVNIERADTFALSGKIIRK